MHLLKMTILGVVILLFSACDEGTIPTTSPNSIMPLGASRVAGARPEFESFRYELWKDLVANGWEFDFVGTQKDPADYASFQGREFDADHEGRGGWTSSQILANIDEWLDEAGTPDVILFSSPAGNDLLDGQDYNQALANINAIIDRIQEHNPAVTIVIERMAPAHSSFMTPALTQTINQLHSDILDLSSAQSTATSRVIAVDMFTGFGDNFLADNVHYNAAGAGFIAAKYYDVLVDVLR